MGHALRVCVYLTATLWQLDTRTLWVRDATVASEQTAEFVFRAVAAYKRYFFRNMASENSQETLGVRNAFSYVDIGTVRGFKPKKQFWNFIQACVIINSVSLRT